MYWKYNTLADAKRNGADWKYILYLPLDWLRLVGFDFSVLSEFRDCLIEDELLQKPMILINLGRRNSPKARQNIRLKL